MEGDRLVGSVRARETDGVCQIGRLIVDPRTQGHGAGTMLMRHIEAAFPQARVFELFTGSRSEGNLRLYERLGYTRTREKVVSPALRSFTWRSVDDRAHRQAGISARGQRGDEARNRPRPPRGVPKKDFARLDWYDVWFPVLRRVWAR
jgi:hypothetical protein